MDFVIFFWSVLMFIVEDSLITDHFKADYLKLLEAVLNFTEVDLSES